MRLCALILALKDLEKQHGDLDVGIVWDGRPVGIGADSVYLGEYQGERLAIINAEGDPSTEFKV